MKKHNNITVHQYDWKTVQGHITERNKQEQTQQDKTLLKLLLGGVSNIHPFLLKPVTLYHVSTALCCLIFKEHHKIARKI